MDPSRACQKARHSTWEAGGGEKASLRLGDSCLIVGEVRSVEAKALYEAMRVGALANVVAGTIHGASPYGVFDRVVNDLNVILDISPISYRESLRKAFLKIQSNSVISSPFHYQDVCPSLIGDTISLVITVV